MQMFHRVCCRLQAIPAEVASSVPPNIRAATIVGWNEKISSVLLEMSKWEMEDSEEIDFRG